MLYFAMYIILHPMQLVDHFLGRKEMEDVVLLLALDVELEGTI
jgi:hypothetical protein